MTGWNTLVQAETLLIALSRADLALVDCRFTLGNPGAGELAYQIGHIPGAVYAHLDRDLSDQRRANPSQQPALAHVVREPGVTAERSPARRGEAMLRQFPARPCADSSRNQGEGRHPWPEAADFTAKLGAWGITPQHQVVAYDDDTGAYAARLWFLLRALGHAKVAVLDGGWARWTELGLPMDSQISVPHAARYTGRFDVSRLLDAQAVQARLDAGELLIDARAADRFSGRNETLDRVAGHVPGARNRPYTENLAHGRFKPPAQLADEFRALLGAHTPEQVMVMCGSGVTACHHLLAMERAGLHGAKVFTGSWSGWIADPSRPVATG
jgi:thiosulfate/3-mercaptopyruvate sulfurtransferase